MKAKHILIGVGIVVAGAALWSWDYVRKTRAVFERMRVYISAINSVSFVNVNQVNFNVSFILQNPTDAGFTVTTANVAKLKQLVVYYKGQYLAHADLNLAQIDIPPYNSIEITDVPFTLSLANVVEGVILSGEIDTANFTLTAIIEMLGRDYKIENQFTA